MEHTPHHTEIARQERLSDPSDRRYIVEATYKDDSDCSGRYFDRFATYSDASGQRKTMSGL